MKQASHRTTEIPTEGETVELKESLGEWKEIVETCAAFANARGGRIFVGVSQDGKVRGVQAGKGTLEDLVNKIGQNTSPRIVPSMSTHLENGKTILLVEVAESATKPVYAFERPFRRSGRSNQRLSPGEAAQLYLDSRGVTWDETLIPEATMQDIASERVKDFLHRSRHERRWNIDPESPPQKVLAQLGLLHDRKLTAAGLLLFGKDPQRCMAQAMLRCARFKGDDTVQFLDMKVIEGTILDQVEEAMAFVKRHISMSAQIKDLEREERWEYPLNAIREAITNAICHRDYADAGNVQVRIFDHGLEVWNPGALPPGLTVDDLRRNHESKPRNKLIARAFFLIRYIEQFGTGTGRMIEECRKTGVPEPVFESRPGGFRISFQKSVSLEERLAGIKLNERQRKGVQYVEEHGQITRKEYEKVTKTPPATAKRDLSELMKVGVLERGGRGRSISYGLSAQIVSRNLSRKKAEKPREID